jgi:hypothetical protein
MDALKTAQSQAISIGKSLETEGLNALVTGFSFAAAIAWMDVVRAIIGRVISVSKNGVTNATMVAVLTTLLSVIVFMLLSRVSKAVKKPQSPVYTVQ